MSPSPVSRLPGRAACERLGCLTDRLFSSCCAFCIGPGHADDDGPRPFAGGRRRRARRQKKQRPAASALATKSVATFPCDDCDREYLTAESLRSHVRNLHWTHFHTLVGNRGNTSAARIIQTSVTALMTEVWFSLLPVYEIWRADSGSYECCGLGCAVRKQSPYRLSSHLRDCKHFEEMPKANIPWELVAGTFTANGKLLQPCSKHAGRKSSQVIPSTSVKFAVIPLRGRLTHPLPLFAARRSVGGKSVSEDAIGSDSKTSDDKPLSQRVSQMTHP